MSDSVRQQFTSTAGEYARGTIMPDDEPMARMLRLLHRYADPRAHALDIATGAGHTAFQLRQMFQKVSAIDITPAMLDAARENAKNRGITDIQWLLMDAQELQFEEGAFGVATCRYAPHHFADLARALREVFRVLEPGGVFYLLDNGSPDHPAASALVDEIEKLRDPSHVHSITPTEWRLALQDAGFRLLHFATYDETYPLETWFARAKTPEANRLRILEILKQAPAALNPHIQVGWREGVPVEVSIRPLMIEAVAMKP